MKRKDLKNLTEKSPADLGKFIAGKKLELTKFYANLGAGKEKNLKAGKSLKRDIAQASTILHLRHLAEEKK